MIHLMLNYTLIVFVICSSDISIEFATTEYAVNEKRGLLQPVLKLDAPLECCSVSVTVKFEDITAKSKYFQIHTCTYECIYSMHVSSIMHVYVQVL